MLKSIFMTILLSGCTIDQVEFAHQSTVETRARGVGLHHSGSFAQIGMLDNTCDIQTSTGFIGSDFDLVVGEEDKVEDTFGSLALVTGTSGQELYILDREDYSSYFVDAVSVDQARFYNDGVVILSNCNLTWMATQEDQISVGVPCGEGFAVDPNTGAAYLGTPDGLVVASPNDIQTTGVPGTLIAYDSTLGMVYTATSGDNTVIGVREGAQVWSTDLDQPISSLDGMGERGMVAVMIGDSDSGAIVTLDGLTGSISTIFQTPSTANNIDVSGNGSVIAITLDDEVHFYKAN